MKQILSIALALLPCLAWAQYPSNGNQKITLGEQTTADGLIWRGVLADTGIINPASDTSAYIILDTVNHRFYNYNRATNVWSVAGGGTAVTSITGGTGLTGGTITSTGTLAADTNFLVTRYDTSAMLTPYWRAGNFSGTLPVANGGTNASTFTAGSVVFAGASGTYTQDNSGLFFDNTNNRLGINTASPLGLLEARSTVGGTQNGLFSLYENSGTSPYFTFRKARGTPASPSAVQLNDGMGELSFQGYHPDGFDNAVVLRAFNYLAPGASFLNGGLKILINSQAGGGLAERVTIISNGNFGIGTATPSVQLHTTGDVRFAGLASITDLRTDADGDLFNGSDFNLKNSIDTINFGLQDVLKLKPVQFNWNDISRNLNDYKNLGFIAQDVMDVIPNAVSSMGDGDMQVDYNAIVATLTKAIQEQQALIKALEQRIINLENK